MKKVSVWSSAKKDLHNQNTISLVGWKMKTNHFSTFITHDTVNNEYNGLVICTVPEHVFSFRESSVSVCIESTVAIPEPKQSLSPKCFDTLGYVRSLFVLGNPINTLSDSYPVTWVAKVVALLTPVADSLTLYWPCVD